MRDRGQKQALGLTGLLGVLGLHPQPGQYLVVFAAYLGKFVFEPGLLARDGLDQQIHPVL